MKKYKYHTKKIIKMLILILLIILIIVIVVFILSKNKKKSNDVVAHANPIVDVIDDKNDEVLNFGGVGVFFDRFTGELKASEVAKELERDTIERLPKTYEMIKDYKEKSELEIFYNNNENSLKNMFGFENSSDFISFANKLQEKDLDLNTWYRLDVKKDTFVDESSKEGYAYVEYVVSYKDDSEIVFTLYVAKSSTIEPQYIVNIK